VSGTELSAEAEEARRATAVSDSSKSMAEGGNEREEADGALSVVDLSALNERRGVVV
jgi:hypothetical protein